MRIGYALLLICFVLTAIQGAIWQKLESNDRAE
jgi:hypothetical protein